MLRRLATVIVAGLALTACGSGPSDELSTGSTTGPAPEAPIASTPGTSEPAATGGGSAVLPLDVPEALQVTAPLIGGGDIELATLAGRPVLLWFWAPW